MDRMNKATALARGWQSPHGRQTTDHGQVVIVRPLLQEDTQGTIPSTVLYGNSSFSLYLLPPAEYVRVPSA
jgi:hypothetical protein